MSGLSRASITQSSNFAQVSDINKEFSFSRAETFEDLCAAFALAYELYLRAGYCDPHPSNMRFPIQLLLPVGQTFVAKNKEHVAATASMILDSYSGIPADALFKSEIDFLRRLDREICEGTLLACDNYGSFRAHQLSEVLIPLTICWAIAHAHDDFLLVVNPKHVRFWSDRVGFSIISEERSCPYVKGAPGVLLRLDLRALFNLDDSTNTVLRFLLQGWPRLEELEAPPLLACPQVAALLCQQPELLQSASEQQRAALEEAYPGLIQLVTRWNTFNKGTNEQDLRR